MSTISSRMPFNVGSTTACVRVFPHAFVSFGQDKCGCRVAFQEAAKVGKLGNGGFCFMPLSPSCRIRGRNSSGNQKRSQARRVRDPPHSETKNRTGEAGRDNKTPVHGAQALTIAPGERLPLGDGGGLRSQRSITSTDASIAETDGSGASSGVPVEVQRLASGYRDGSGVNGLMLLVKEAETNIRTLNELRERAVDELQSARKEKEDLQSQVEVLKARLADSEAKLEHTVQAREKAQLLEEEVVVMKQRLAQTEADSKALPELKEQNKALHESLNSLQHSGGKGALEAKYQSSLDEVNSLRVHLADAQAEIAKFFRGPERESAGLQEYIAGLENKIADMERQLAEANANSAEIESLKVEGMTLHEEAAALRMKLAGRSDNTSHSSAGGDTKDQSLQHQVETLQSLLSQAMAERDALLKVRRENVQLREQVELLEERIRVSDAEIQAQLQIYTAEVEAFQASLGDLKSGNEINVAHVPVGEMPWEFWSGLQLRISALMMSDMLTQEDGKELQLMAWRREKRLRDVYINQADMRDEDLAVEFKNLIQPTKRPGLHIIHISAEMAPVAKVGGLGDVLTGLSRSFQKKGHLVEAILPKYDCMDYSRIANLKELDMELHSSFDGKIYENKVWTGIVEGLPVYFIEPLHPEKFFWRGQFYSTEPDDFRRFTYFCRAALEFLLQSGKRPDIIHSHDWQTAVVAPLYWDIYVPLGLDSARLAFTCHNFQYQGVQDPAAITACGLSARDLMRPDRMQDNSAHNRINLLKGGIVFSNVVTTVSPTYAQEVLLPEGGKGLQGTLGVHSKKFFGILNGIDEEVWDPATDVLIDHQYSADNIDGKFINKQKLRERLGMASQGDDEKRPLVACVTRLVPQKGVHLIRHSIYRTLEKGGQFILLGSSPFPDIQREFEDIARQFENHPQIRLVLKYDEALSHAIYAAADIFVIPSIFEPCGLTQMISMRYGTIPVVRRTGGLADSVFDVDDQRHPEEQKNGFVFDDANEGSLSWGLDRALDYYTQRPEWWQDLVKRAMQMDLSWDASADQYLDLYEQVLSKVKV
ncbi:hypothetical protein KC19_9G183000 [Ceratodon purpureus]|uniref:starch synthase n=2 Tax=Ceratodon purpureus TaxID=3225 RepID=A0A8T0GTA1_CERPU|nr:hypothetical protein KC19_9G183000 [Ceratodon purpureus]